MELRLSQYLRGLGDFGVRFWGGTVGKAGIVGVRKGGAASAFAVGLGADRSSLR
jgi:hypothetical protein